MDRRRNREKKGGRCCCYVVASHSGGVCMCVPPRHLFDLFKKKGTDLGTALSKRIEKREEKRQHLWVCVAHKSRQRPTQHDKKNVTRGQHRTFFFFLFSGSLALFIQLDNGQKLY
jgi:hypothetical protein